MLAGLVAGVVGFCFAFLVGESSVNSAIAFERRVAVVSAPAKRSSMIIAFISSAERFSCPSASISATMRCTSRSGSAGTSSRKSIARSASRYGWSDEIAEPVDHLASKIVDPLNNLCFC